tara:strand:+ start:1975 stop:2271 length:297 start_codon:yes stop_codon:yes gene_type:complete
MTLGDVHQAFILNLTQGDIVSYNIVSYLQHQGNREDVKDVLEENIESEEEALELSGEYEMAFGSKFQILIVVDEKEMTRQQFVEYITVSDGDRYGDNP